jgi:acetyl-CoA carboxylase biotin carboxyl carrier protein
MFDLEFVERLIRSLDESSLDSLEIERGGTRIRLSKTPQPTHAAPVASAAAPSTVVGGGSLPAAPSPASAVEASAPAEAHSAQGLLEVLSPMVGTFFRAPSPTAPNFAEVGQRITKGDALCIIEAMKLMNELESEVEGTIREILVENGEPVEYGQVLFRVQPS